MTPPLCDPAVWRDLADLIAAGGSLTAACRKRGLDVTAVRAAVREEPAFAELLRQAYGSLAENVLARLYAAAMDGSVPAIGLFLKTVPVPRPGEKDADAPDDDLCGADRQQLEDALRHITAECQHVAGGDPAPPSLARSGSPPVSDGVPPHDPSG